MFQVPKQEPVAVCMFLDPLGLWCRVYRACALQVINAYSLIEPGRVAVRNRVAKYLIPSDDLYKDMLGDTAGYKPYSSPSHHRPLIKRRRP